MLGLSLLRQRIEGDLHQRLLDIWPDAHDCRQKRLASLVEHTRPGVLQQTRDNLVDGRVGRRAYEHVLRRRLGLRAPQVDQPIDGVSLGEGVRG